MVCVIWGAHFSLKDQRRQGRAECVSCCSGAAALAQALSPAECLTHMEDEVDVVWSEGSASHSSKGQASGMGGEAEGGVCRGRV